VEEVKGRVGEKEKVLLKIKPEVFLKRVCGILGKKVREELGVERTEIEYGRGSFCPI